jgi:hypothetical protein
VMSGKNERAIRKIFEEEPDLEISVMDIVEKITGEIVFDTSSSLYSSICRTIRRLERKEHYLQSRTFNLFRPVDFNGYPDMEEPSRVKMIRLYEPSRKHHPWFIEMVDSKSKYCDIVPVNLEKDYKKRVEEMKKLYWKRD